MSPEEVMLADSVVDKALSCEVCSCENLPPYPASRALCCVVSYSCFTPICAYVVLCIVDSVSP